MPFTLVGWHESQDTGGALTLTAALADPHVRVVGDDIIVPDLNNIVGLYGLGLYITRMQILSPSLRRIFNPDIEPLDRAGEPLSPPNFHDYSQNPLPLVKSEALNCKLAEDVAGAYWNTALAWLAAGPITPVKGEIFTVRATGSTTLTAYAWTNGALTFTQTLPAGRYQLVGARCQSTGLIAFRFVFPGYAWRPGAIGFDADSDLEPACFRLGRFGVWGEFDHDAPPTVDWLSRTADTSEVLHLDLIKVR